MGCALPTLFNITDITNSLAEPHFKATRWFIGELLKFNTANWQAFPLKYKSFDKYNTLTTKEDSELPCLGQQDLNNYYLLNKRKKQKTIQVRARSKKVFLLNGGR